ncbi:lipopolysaccharide-induced tumor necrosis factor-alpha factor homolog [Tigriopus californicus]|uniref:lipopolysaccharide-induced tumor necrosis factor-alpha factor homolog n=1 Tax=Tigriopus californicus TaxID=6832 RepID=UPI0027DA0908|nr:lipopolysaccharide-induced tumor necrosis factor-alpha factor homolog [Tigriopus californicus]
MAQGCPPPPSYNESVKGCPNPPSRRNSYGAPSGGPTWLYHFPQQSQFNSPYSSLQYEEISPSRALSQLPASSSKLNLGEDPVHMTCPYCHQVIVSVTSPEIGCFAYALSASLCLIGCWPCAFLPCCISDLLDVTHTCPKCKRFLDTFKRGGL